jgi:hypothetical protein
MENVMVKVVQRNVKWKWIVEMMKTVKKMINM